jgi:hypothetical protein
MPFDGTCDATTNTYTYTSTGAVSGSGSAGYTIDFCIGAAVGGMSSGIHQATADGML